MNLRHVRSSGWKRLGDTAGAGEGGPRVEGCIGDGGHVVLWEQEPARLPQQRVGVTRYCLYHLHHTAQQLAPGLYHTTQHKYVNICVNT